jgi:hypothetical protein
MMDTLEYIASGPAQEHGGFDPQTIAAAKWVVARVKELEETLGQVGTVLELNNLLPDTRGAIRDVLARKA